MNNSKNIQVLIVGAGPSGLLIACQLARYNIPFRIIDQTNRSFTYSGALFIQARTLEILDQFGIAQKVLKMGTIVTDISITFDTKKTLNLSLRDIGKGLTKFPYLLMLEQWKTEQLLRSYIEEHGYRVENQTELIQVMQENTSVKATLRPQNGKEETLKTLFLVAADGNNSTVRQQLQIPFVKRTHQISLFAMDCEADNSLNNQTIRFSFTKDGSNGAFPLPNERWRMDGTVPEKLKNRETLTYSDIEKFNDFHPILRTLIIKSQWFAVFHSHHGYAQSFRCNRCFLIGDAAHIVSPVGAQGMNTGMQDAYNLGWKLAYVLKDKSSMALLDTYHTERQPLAKKLLSHADKAFVLVASENFLLKRTRLWIAPLLLQWAFYLMRKYKPIRDLIFEAIAETRVTYRKTYHATISTVGKFPRRAPKPGDRMPYILFKLGCSNVNTYDLLSGSEFKLLILYQTLISKEVEEIIKHYNLVLSVQTIPLQTGSEELYYRMGIKREGFYLIRPDMYIEFRSSKMDLQHLERYLKIRGLDFIHKQEHFTLNVV